MRRRETVYTSGRFQQQEEFRAYRERIRAMGVKVCSTWLDQSKSEPVDRKTLQRIARRDVQDCRRATLAILDFTLPPRGGRETEHGIFIALGTPCWIVNNQNTGNVFSHLGRAFDSWDDALAALRRRNRARR